MLDDQLRDMDVNEIAVLMRRTNSKIDGLKDRYQRDLAVLKLERDQIDDELHARYGALITHAAKQKEEPCGVVTVRLNNHQLKADIPKKVKWDSDIVYDVAQRSLRNEFRRLFGSRVSILERGYRDTTDEDLKALMDQGRTVTYGDPVITLEELEDPDTDDAGELL